MGLEVWGGSSDFWATDGEPRNQFNRYFMSNYCVLGLLCAPRNPLCPPCSRTGNCSESSPPYPDHSLLSLEWNLAVSEGGSSVSLLGP